MALQEVGHEIDSSHAMVAAERLHSSADVPSFDVTVDDVRSRCSSRGRLMEHGICPMLSEAFSGRKAAAPTARTTSRSESVGWACTERSAGMTSNAAAVSFASAPGAMAHAVRTEVPFSDGTWKETL